MAKPKLESRKENDLAYIEHEGPYDKVPWDKYIEMLYAWAKDQKVMPGFCPMGIYLSIPENTPSEKLKSEIAITFKGKAKETADIKIKHVPAMKVASISFKGFGSEFKNTYSILADFIEKKGYVITGPPMEMYTKKPEVRDGVTTLYAKVMFPIAKK